MTDQGVVEDLRARSPAAAALALAARGIPVFPCNPDPAPGRAKAPLVPKESTPGAKDGGLYLATTDVAQIRAWWARTPDALIGMPTGPRSGAWVLDLDPKTHPAQEMLTAVSIFVGVDLANGPRVLTQSGGLHLYFRYPDLDDGYLGNRSDLFRRAVPDRDSPIHRHVDTRGEGGYVIVPPSVMRNGKAYAWQVTGETSHFPDAPPRLLDLVLRRGEFAGSCAALSDDTPSVTHTFAPLSEAPGDKAVKGYARAAMDRVRGDVSTAPTGSRGSTLNAAAFTLGQFVAAGVLSSREATAALQDGADACGLTATDGTRERDAKIRRGLEAGSREAAKLQARLAEVRAEAEERAARYDRRFRPPPASADDYGTVRTVSERPATRDSAGPRGEERDADRQPDDDALADEDGPSPGDVSDVDLAIVEGCALLDASDTDNAERFLRHFGQDFVVVAQEGVAGGDRAVWCGTHWDLAGGTARAQTLASRLGGRVALEAEFLRHTPDEVRAIEAARYLPEDDDEGLTKAEKRLAKARDAARLALRKRQARRLAHAVQTKNAARVDSLFRFADPRARRAPADFNVNRMAVATVTHTLRIGAEDDPECPDPDITRRKGVLVEEPCHRRNDWMTACIAVPWSGLDAPCPKWMKFLDETMPDAAKRRTVQAFTGLGLTAEPVQYLMFHYGEGQNGKSVYLETVMRIIGGFGVGLPRESIIGAGDRGAGGASPDIIRLYGKRMVRILEAKKDAPLQEDLVKRLTGGEAMPARALFKGYLEFQNTAKPHMSGNGFPSVDGGDFGTMRRLLIVHWDQTIPDDKKRELEEMVSEFVREEGPGILAWLVRGVLDYAANGLIIADDIRAATRSYGEEQDPIGQFLRMCVRPAPGRRIAGGELYDAFTNWRVANGKPTRSQKKVGTVATARFAKSEIGGRIFYLDVELHDVPSRPETPGSDRGETTRDRPFGGDGGDL